jgi:hypothetical protein
MEEENKGEKQTQEEQKCERNLIHSLRMELENCWFMPIFSKCFVLIILIYNHPERRKKRTGWQHLIKQAQCVNVPAPTNLRQFSIVRRAAPLH